MDGGLRALRARRRGRGRGRVQGPARALPPPARARPEPPRLPSAHPHERAGRRGSEPARGRAGDLAAGTGDALRGWVLRADGEGRTGPGGDRGGEPDRDRRGAARGQDRAGLPSRTWHGRGIVLRARARRRGRGALRSPGAGGARARGRAAAVLRATELSAPTCPPAAFAASHARKLREMGASRRDDTQDWLLPEGAAPPLLSELEERIDEALIVAKASEKAVMAVGEAALDAAQQARRAADLAERASIAALNAQPPQPPLEDVALRSFS